jgi:hypothetical protein
MSLGLIFWVIMLLCALGGGWFYRTQPFFPGLGVGWVLFFIVGWKVFGFPIQG